MLNNPKFWIGLRSFINVVLIVYMLAPLAVIFIISFSSAQYLTFPPPGFSMQWYEKMFSNPTWTKSLGTSLKIMIPAAFFSTVLGTAAALALSRMSGKWATVLRGLLMAPLIVPVIITAAAIFGVFRIWGLYGTLSGLIIAHVILTLPYVLSTVSAALTLFDTRLEDAAANCGAPPWTAFYRITLPLISPAVLSGLLFAMVISFDELIVSLFLSTPQVRPVTVQMWSNIKGDTDPTIAAIATVLFLFSLLALLLDGLARRRSEPPLVYRSQKSTETRRMTNGNSGNRFTPEIRARAVCLVLENEADYTSRTQAVLSIAKKIGCNGDTLRVWVRNHEIEIGLRNGVTQAERDELKILQRENKELRQANDILRKASAFFAAAELDRLRKK